MKKPPSKPRVGMRADELLKMRGRSRADAVGFPEWIVPRQSAAWHYRDCSVLLEHDGVCYRVKEVKDAGSGRQ